MEPNDNVTPHFRNLLCRASRLASEPQATAWASQSVYVLRSPPARDRRHLNWQLLAPLQGIPTAPMPVAQPRANDFAKAFRPRPRRVQGVQKGTEKDLDLGVSGHILIILGCSWMELAPRSRDRQGAWVIIRVQYLSERLLFASGGLNNQNMRFGGKSFPPPRMLCGLKCQEMIST